MTFFKAEVRQEPVSLLSAVKFRRSFWKDENIVYNCFVTFHTKKTNSIYGAFEEETPMIANKKSILAGRVPSWGIAAALFATATTFIGTNIRACRENL
ncbi:hypothetical protein T08_13828 [Trichinella sp. T8]|nr:hypothetical protein T08_9556 [Trichinella sp. T8]KRZ82304.1 hypothetical protein T08_13828 [Trichinella sp. T8]